MLYGKFLEILKTLTVYNMFIFKKVLVVLAMIILGNKSVVLLIIISAILFKTSTSLQSYLFNLNLVSFSRAVVFNWRCASGLPMEFC